MHSVFRTLVCIENNGAMHFNAYPELHNSLSKSNQILTANASWNRVQTVHIFWKSCKGYASVGHLYFTFWSNLSKNFILGVLYPYRCTNVGEIWHGGSLLHAKFHPHRCDLFLWGEKPENRPLGNLSNQRFALRAMLQANNINKSTTNDKTMKKTRNVGQCPTWWPPCRI